MRKLITILTLLTFAVAAHAQELYMETLPAKDGKVYYEYINDVPNTPKDEIYQRIKKWASYNIRSGKTAIDYDDREAGEIIVKCYFTEKWNPDPFKLVDVKVYSLFHFMIKDNRYKLTVSNFRIDYGYVCLHCDNSPKNIAIEDWNNNQKKNKKNFLQKISPQIITFHSEVQKEVLHPVQSDNW